MIPLFEIFRTGKSIEVKSRLMVARGYGGLVTANGLGILGGDGYVQELDADDSPPILGLYETPVNCIL